MQASKHRLLTCLRRLYPYVIFLLFAVMVIFPQIHHRIFIAGLDSYFHMNRFYEDAMQIKTGHFSYFQSLFSFRQTGRIVNAFYGPWFSYLMGFLLLMVHSWFRFQVVFSILTIFLSAIFMYRLMRDNYVKWAYSVLIALMYSISFPVQILIFKQEFTGMGAVLFPLILLLGTKMIKARKVSVIPLAVVMAIAFQIHLLSGLIGGLILLPFAVWTLIRTNYKKIFCKSILEALALFMILTANLWGAILEVSTSSRLIPTFPQTNMTGPFDAVSLSRTNRYVILTPIDLKLLIGILTLIVVSWWWMTGLTRLVSVMGVFAFWLSSDYFPWNTVIRRYPGVTNMIQFPKRFLPLVSVLSLFALGLILSQIDFKRVWASRSLRFVLSLGLLGLLALSLVNVHQTMTLAISRWNRPRVLYSTNLIAYRDSPHRLRQALVGPELNDGGFVKELPDYLPTSLTNIDANEYFGHHLYRLTRNQLDNENSNYRKRVDNNGNLQLNWRNPRRTNQIFKLSMVRYGHTRIELNRRRVPIRNVKVTPVGAMLINSRPGNNQLNISYHSSAWFKDILWLNVVCWLLVIIDLIRMLISKIK